jgi:large subunit ribosomal protein L21
VPQTSGPSTAVVVSGGKQYRVAAGDRILVDRLTVEPGQEFNLDRVLLHADGDDLKIGTPTVEGVVVGARVIAHKRGPKIDVLRYKSKKHVRVHRGARSDLTAIEIVSIGAPKARQEKAEKASKPDKPRAAARKKPAKAEAEDGA